MAPKFGTSGLRGLVTELTPDLVASHVLAFIHACPIGTGLYVGYDLRPSSPELAEVVISAAREAGVNVTDCGATPTPALALASIGAGAAAIMITGSHIPADRNGLKFYTPKGEISKADEAAILDALETKVEATTKQGSLSRLDAGPGYVDRYVRAYGSDALSGLRVGVYTHSTVGRDLMIDILSGLGAETVEFARSDTFIPVDTEAVAPEVREQLKVWAEVGLDALVSMDGDGDRPLLTDETGEVVPGDILGQITAMSLGAKNVVTPVSSNSGVGGLGFDNVIRTRIGSPYVIAGMEDIGGDVVGYEANGGFLLGFDGPLSPLMTRDSMLPIVATLIASKGQSVSSVVAQQPECFTAADRLQEVPTETSKALVQRLNDDPTPFVDRLGGTIADVDRTDGLRMTLTDGRIVHLRPSGNAPELRCYVEDKSKSNATETLELALKTVKDLLVET